MAASRGAERRVQDEAPYERDFYGWCLHQAALVRAGRLEAVDRENLAEELEALGREQEHALESSLRVLLIHLLKWRWQPQRRSRSWRATIVRERGEYESRLARNPGLKPKRQALLAVAYRRARREAAAETGVETGTFPEACPFTLEQVVDDEFWPEA
ncbi:MAG TPA: DUF29 domain-containing protein [Geminicoccaceae bacterium]|nr:DUF29 domain-containing protein [Geminicoccaceae bacterium]